MTLNSICLFFVFPEFALKDDVVLGPFALLCPLEDEWLGGLPISWETYFGSIFRIVFDCGLVIRTEQLGRLVVLMFGVVERIWFLCIVPWTVG